MLRGGNPATDQRRSAMPTEPTAKIEELERTYGVKL